MCDILGKKKASNMELNPDDELFVLESSVDTTHENGDIMMLEELYRQEKFIESLQQFTEKELSKLDDSNNAQPDLKLIRDFANDSNFNPDKTFSSTLFQESTNYELSTLQIDEDELIDLILENEDVMLVDNQSFVDCGTIDYNDKLDYYETDEFQMDSILTEYLTTVDSSSDPLGDPKIQCQATVRLERLPESITKVKDTAEVKTNQRIELNDRKKSVELYCHKCKRFTIDNKRISMPKNCQDCGNLLIYLCTKCKEKYFITYSVMRLHWKICRSKKPSAEVPTSLFLYDCRDCDFRTLYEDSVDRHLRKTKHRFNDVDGNLRVDKHKDVKYTREFEKDYKKAFKRFCKKCNKIISSTSNADDKRCKECDTPLFYRCIKCHVTSKTYKSLIYHLKNKCLLKIYKCCKCDFITNRWKFMQRHMKWKHLSRINCEYCDFETNRKSILVQHLALKHNVGDVFCCKICNKYRTAIAYRLEKHILRRHSEKNDVSETFECANCRRYSTNDQNDLWKHIDRRHCEK